jgi:signal transduction histidine kinase
MSIAAADQSPNTTKEQSGSPNNEISSKRRITIQNAALVAAAAISLVALYVLSRYNYLLFHGATEVFSIVIAFTIFAISWNCRHIMDNKYLTFLGIAFLFVAGLDLIHTLAYKGMGVFPNVGSNLATQLWIATRYMLSFSLLIPLLFTRRRIRPSIIIAGYASVTTLLLVSIFYWGNFPQAYLDGVGLTAFKVGSEYIISSILLVSVGILYIKRKEFNDSIFKLLMAAMSIAVATEMAFTLYADVYGVANMVGHLLNVVSFYLIYRALVETGLTKPYELLFRNLKNSESKLANDAVEIEKYATRMEELAEERAKQLKDNERLTAIGQTAGMVGHDLRNPLQSIIGEVYLAKSEIKELPESEQKTNLQESVEAIAENISYMDKIVSDLQAFVKPVEAHKQTINIKQMLDGLIAQIDMPENIELNMEIGDDLAADADPQLLKRVLINLVTNAVQAMPDGGKLTIKSQTNNQGQVQIIVEDTGVGIPEEVKPKIFTPLFTTKSKGQGFGLAVCKRVMEAQGGTIDFNSQEGEGATFTISLPISPKN